MKLKIGSEDEQVEDNGDDGKRHTSTYQQHSDREHKRKIKTRRFKEESRPDGQHSPSTATSSKVALEHA